MTLAEAILTAESYFQVHREIGYAEPFYKDGRPVEGAETRDMTFAPCGQQYVTLTSGGIKDQRELMPMWFAEESRAVSYWLFSVEDYAESVAPRDDWKKLHLYWRDMPTWNPIEMVAVDQAALLANSHPLHGEAMVMTAGVVWSRLLITKLRPDGTEED